MKLKTLQIAGKCGTCGDTFEAKGDDEAVQKVWSLFRHLHEHDKGIEKAPQ